MVASPWASVQDGAHNESCRDWAAMTLEDMILVRKTSIPVILLSILLYLITMADDQDIKAASTDETTKAVEWTAWPGTWSGFQALRHSGSISGAAGGDRPGHKRMVTLTDTSSAYHAARRFWTYQEFPLPGREAPTRPDPEMPSRPAPSLPAPTRLPPSKPAPSRMPPPRPLDPITEEDSKARDALMDKYDTILFDCDGVLWRGTEAIEGAAEVIDTLRKMDKRVYFITNNSTKSRSMYVEKMATFGIEAQPSDIFGSAWAAASYLSECKQFDSSKQKAVIVGASGLEAEFKDAGIQTTLVNDLAGETGQLTHDEVATMDVGDNIGAVVVGLDTSFTYWKCAIAAKCLHLNPEAVFLATNKDATFVAPAALLPGTGAIVDMVTSAALRNPDVVVGKPEPFFFEKISQITSLEPSKALLIGDRLDTDIAWGNRNGIDTLLVLSGVTTEVDVFDETQQEKTPKFVCPTVAHILDLPTH